MAHSKRSKVVISVLAATVVAALVGAWSLMYARGRSSDSDLVAAKAAIEEIGFTVDPDELGRRLFVPSDENAAPILVSVGYLFTLEGEIGQLLNDQETSADTCLIYHQQHPDVYELLLEAAGKSGCDFGRDWSKGPVMLLPELSQAKRMARYCAVLAEADVNEGDYNAALQKLLVADRIGWHMGGDPTMICKLVELACRSIVFREVVHILADHPNDRAMVDLVTRLGGLLRPLEDLNWSLQGEVISGHVTISEYTSEEMRLIGGGFETGPGSEDRFDPKFRAAGEAIFLERMVELHGIWSQTGLAQDGFEMTEAFSHAIENDKRPGAEYAVAMMFFYSNPYRSSAVVDTASILFRHLGEVLATVREEGIEVAVEKYDGRFDDEANGKKYRLKAVPGGFKFYSMGWDGEDDGGPETLIYPGRDEVNDDFGFWISLGTD